MRFIDYRAGISVALTSALISTVLMAPPSGSRVKLATMDMGRKKFSGGKRL